MGAASGAKLAAAQKGIRPGAIPGTHEAKQVQPKAARPVRKQEPETSARGAAKPAKAAGASSGEVKELKSQIAELKEELEQMNQERDFYYEKLRKIEDFCQDNEEEAIVQSILNILYEADEEKGFLPPDDEDDDDDE
ncbi:hypothetical protein TRFO_04868 [Tritrichomonas foetus]|uniref:EB1 C-terminal domain-containing protein n=1 Tax=Tritrichomonas foetus TaxID=1144522 RepID=A0A1J4KA11_9EUKA|nr:hypothetical protein TRFO_04868 [Tritrichomonas foetus]|eukprot:OHT08271.1 hypothetical protein TRFO_04868 [Tritrichomonas foetus]